MDKKCLGKDFLSIKEFAELAGLSVSALRHYDKVGAFLPEKHGSGFENNYRYYTPTQITTVNMIRVLTEIGISLSSIKELANNRSPEKILKLLHSQKKTVSDRIHILQEAYSVINVYMELLYSGMSAIETDITITEMPETSMFLGDTNDFSNSVSFYSEFIRFCNALRSPRLNLSYPIGGYFDSITEFLNTPSQPTRFFSLDPNGNEKKADGLYLIGYSRGYYGQTNDLPQRMAAYAAKNNLAFKGPVYNIYIFDEISIVEPEQYLLQASVSVLETRSTPKSRLHGYF